MKTTNLFHSKIKDWIINKMKYDRYYPVREDKVDTAKEVIEELNREQDVYILSILSMTIGKEKYAITKRDNTKNPRLYFVDEEYEEWDNSFKKFVKKKHDVPQRHQLARIIARKDPELGAEMMKEVKYEIPEPEIDYPNDQN